MPPSKPQKYTAPTNTSNSYWEQFLPPQPVAPVVQKPQAKPPTAPVIQAPAPAPSNPWLPLYIAPPPRQGAPQQPAYNPLPTAPPPRPQYNPLPQQPVQQNQAPQQWRPELIQPISRPNIGAAPIQTSQPFVPTVAPPPTAPFAQQQGPQPRPQNYNGYIAPTLPGTTETPWRYPQQVEAQSAATYLPMGEKFNQAAGSVSNDFKQSAAYGQMQYYNQQLDERRPYGTAGVWDMWQQVQEGAGQIGQSVAKAFQDTGSTPQERFQAAKELGAGLLGGALNIADAPRDTAIGYAATAPIVGAMNASQAALRYGATREVGNNTVGEYVASYAGAAVNGLMNMVESSAKANANLLGANFKQPGYYDPNKAATESLQGFQKAGQLTPQEQQKLAAISPGLPQEVQKQIELNYGTVESQQLTRDQLVQKYTQPAVNKEQAQKYMELAATTKDKGEKDNYLALAAEAGYKAMKQEQTNPYEIVDSNTSWQQMLIEVAAPDPLFDGIGAAFKVLGAFGDPMKKVFGTVKERRMLNSVDDFIKVLPEQIAVDIEKLNLSPQTKQIFAPHSKIFTWTSGTVKAQQDSYNLTKAVIGLLSDVDNARDARILLNIMSDSKALSRAIREGIPYQMLNSQLLRDLADEAGMVRLGFSQFADKGVQNAMKTWGNISQEFLQNADSLKKAKFDKVAFASEFIDTVREAGYSRYTVAKAAGKGAQTNYANVVSGMMQRTMSTFQIKLNPGSWVRDVAATAGLALGDGVFAGVGDWRKSIEAMYPGLVPSVLVEGEKLTGAAMTEQRALNRGLGSIPKLSAPIEENMANNIFAKSVLEMNKKYIPKALNESLAPLLKSAGVDQRTTNAIVNQLSHTLRTQGKAAMVKEFNNVVSGISKPFDLKQYAGQIDKLLTVDELDEIYKTVRTVQSPEQFQSALDNILDKAQERYTRTVIESPVAPQRYDWTNVELSQDAGDFSQTAEMAVRNGLNPDVAKQATAEAVAAAEKEKGLLDTLVQFITDSQDPNARYALYNVWAQRQEILVNTRVRLSEMAEDVIARGGQELWNTEYFPAAKEMWQETRGRIEQVINDGKRLLNEGQDLSQNYSAWGQLERAARSDEAKLGASLLLEPQSAKYDGAAMREVMAAKRAIEDRAAARAYAAARRVIAEKGEATTDVMDVLLAADRDINIAGAKVRAYLNQQFARLMGENGKVSSKGWEQYFSLRNAKWREHTEYSVARWRAAEGQATLYGKGTGITWSDPFTTAPKGAMNGQYNDTLELIGESSKPGQWWVRTPEGNHILMPDATVKTAKPKVPQEAIDQYRTGYKATELSTEDELDNIMSGMVVFDNADKLQYAKAEQESLKVARDSMRTEWDRVAKGNYGLPGLDQMIATYKRNGIVSVGEGKKFEDLYGNVIGGMQIDNSADLERFLSSYSGLAEKAKTTKATKLEQTMMAVEDMPPLWAWNDPDFVPPAGLTKERHEEIVSMMEQALIEQSQAAGAAGAVVAPHSGHMASQGVEQVAHLRQQLMNAFTEYSQMTPNKVSEAMQLQLYQAFRQQAVPAVDNVLKAAADYGDKMRSFVVPDRLNKTRVDELLALVMPYHFWFTRTAKNSIERMIYEPGAFRRLNQLQADLPQLAASAQGIEQDPNMPTRYQGAVPMVIGGKTYYMYLDLGQFSPNMVSMLANKFASPDSSEGGLQYALESMQSLGFGLYPFMADAVGLASGAKNKQDVRPLGYFPLGRTLAWEASNIFGVENMPSALRAGNEEYLIGRQVSNMAQQGNITANEAAWAMDYLRQVYGGDKPLPEQQRLVPDARMQEIIDQATQSATLENRQKYLSSMSGVSVAPYNNTESQILAAQDQYFGSQYPANPYGGKTASQGVIDENAGLTARWGQKAITNQDVTRPGIGAAKQAMYGDQKELKDSLTQAGSASVDAAIAANPAITKKQMYDARVNGMLQYASGIVGAEALQQWLASNPSPSTGDVSKFVVDATMGKNYPSVYNPNPTYAPNQYSDAGLNASERAALVRAGGKLPTAGMNPVEQKDYSTSQAVDYATYNYPGKPVYVKGDKSYGDKLAAWEAERAGWLSTQLGVSGEEATSLIDEKANANKTEAELQRADDIDAEFARREIEWQNKRVNVISEFGEESGAIWDSYYGLPKGDARKAYALEHPEIKAYNMAAWNPNEYAEAKALFGADAWMQWAKVPAYADTDEAKAARAAYWDEHPNAKVLNAWVNGRPANYDESKDDGVRYNFGKDYAEAMKLYGDDIWSVFGGYKSGWDKLTKRGYFSEHGTFSDFLTWWYGGEKKEYTPRSGGRSGGGGGGGGGGYSYNRTAPVNYDRNVQIYSQGLSQGLAATGMPDQWRPSWMNINQLLQSGKELRPDRAQPWRAINVKKIAG